MSALLTLFLRLIPIYFLITRRRYLKKPPPGSLGIPIIGQSLGLLRAMRANTAEQWLQERIRMYGPVSKLSLLGTSTVFIYGQAANKLVFNSDCSTLANQQTKSMRMILDERTLSELSGEDHKQVRGVLVSFLKPESLGNYVGKMDKEMKKHLELHWHGKKQVTVLPLMKTLTFNIIRSLLFGVEQGGRRYQFVNCFQEMIAGVWSIPVNFPFTCYNHSLRASRSVQNMVKDLIRKKRMKLEKKIAFPHDDLITCLLSSHDQNDEDVIFEKEIIDNVMLIMFAGCDTASILITFMLHLLVNHTVVYEAVLSEQKEVAKSKPMGESLTWDDLAKMKYTWKVALETLRMVPLIYSVFRKVLRDIEFADYHIPKGWQIFWVSNITHMDDSTLPDPSKFDPSRFENQASIPPYCYIPFGGGPRKCPGYELSRIETLLTIHYLITQFSGKQLCADTSFSRDPMPVPAEVLPIQIEPRQLLQKAQNIER